MAEESMEENASCSSSATATAAAPTPPQHDDFSLFLHHFLHPSSSSHLARTQGVPPPHQQLHFLFLPPDNIHYRPPASLPTAGDGISPSGGHHLPSASGAHAPSSSLGASGNETDEYDCESEEGLEALLEDIPPKPNPLRSSSKRSRTAEVHNLSEKRRRSRINEKMKALQSLIPNSNKTDKASMLDEAIEYLKQLQLQVQMLSMRNGLTLHPMCLPGSLHPAQIPQVRALFGEESENLQGNMTGSSDNIPNNQEPSAHQTIFGSTHQQSTSNEPHIPNMFDAAVPPFGLEPSLHIHPGAYQLNSSSEEVCREHIQRNQESNVNPSDTMHLFGGRNMYQPKIKYEGGASAAGSLPFASPQPSNDIQTSGRDQSQD